jgi:maleylacetoacetate isomerase/maleylpyruvate isomerase
MSEFVLYSYFRSSASYRVRIALHYKGIPFEYRAVHLLNNGGEQHSEGYRELNPSREVPTVVHNGRPLSQSVAIIDYLDHVRPEPRLFPLDPYERARVLQACEIPNSGAQPVHNLRVLNDLEKRFGASSEQKNQWAAHWITYGLDALEGMLSQTAGAYSFGDRVTAADCFLIPHLANAARFGVALTPYPTLARIGENCKKLESFQRAAPDRQPDTPAS